MYMSTDLLVDFRPAEKCPVQLQLSILLAPKNRSSRQVESRHPINIGGLEIFCQTPEERLNYY